MLQLFYRHFGSGSVNYYYDLIMHLLIYLRGHWKWIVYIYVEHGMAE